MSGAWRLRPLAAREVSDAIRRGTLAFGPPDEGPEWQLERFRDRAERGELWVLEEPDGPILGQLTLMEAAHWFGGRTVPCQLVSGVAVPPEFRGRGVATAMMRAAIERGAAAGKGLSLLFPASTLLYRKLGYEHAGTFHRWRLETRDVPGGGPAMRPARDADWAGIASCHARACALSNGPLAREDRHWARLRHRAGFAYVHDDAEGRIDGYLLFEQHRAADDWRYTLRVTDWQATSPDALAAVVGFAGRHGTIGTAVEFRAPTPNPWALLLPEQDIEQAGAFDWMARGLDPVAAVAARGFPSTAELAVTFAIEDPLLDAARGPWRLEVSEGRGSLTPADEAEATVRACGFGPLFTGYRTPAGLALAGLLSAPTDALERLAAAFAGPLPTAFDFF